MMSHSSRYHPDEIIQSHSLIEGLLFSARKKISFTSFTFLLCGWCCESKSFAGEGNADMEVNIYKPLEELSSIYDVNVWMMTRRQHRTLKSSKTHRKKTQIDAQSRNGDPGPDSCSPQSPWPCEIGVTVRRK